MKNEVIATGDKKYRKKAAATRIWIMKVIPYFLLVACLHYMYMSSSYYSKTVTKLTKEREKYKDLYRKSLGLLKLQLQTQNSVKTGLLREDTKGFEAHSQSKPAVGGKFEFKSHDITAEKKKHMRTALIVICYNRPQYLERTLKSVIKNYPQGADRDRLQMVVSQDGHHAGVNRVATQFINKYKNEIVVKHMHHSQGQLRGENGYKKLARHFGWAFETIFGSNEEVQEIIVLEDDMEIAPDFFQYFFAMLPVLRSDPTLWTVSAWNDNGQKEFVRDTEAVLRSDFFPGLGWVMTRELWKELGPANKWAPGGYWDDWMRLPEQRKNRQVLRPEVSRSYTFGEVGVSASQFYAKYLKPIRLNDKAVDWEKFALRSDSLKADSYRKNYMARVDSARVIDASGLRALKHGSHSSGSAMKVYYSSLDGRGEKSFKTLANILGIMSDNKAGVPRTAYNGIVQIRLHGAVVYLVPW